MNEWMWDEFTLVRLLRHAVHALRVIDLRGAIFFRENSALRALAESEVEFGDDAGESGDVLVVSVWKSNVVGRSRVSIASSDVFNWTAIFLSLCLSVSLPLCLSFILPPGICRKRIIRCINYHHYRVVLIVRCSHSRCSASWPDE